MTDAKIKKLLMIDMIVERGYQFHGWCQNKFNDLVYIAPSRSLIWKQREIENENTTIEIPKTFQCFKALAKGNLKCPMFS